jgi:hypothetical protein
MSSQASWRRMEDGLWNCQSYSLVVRASKFKLNESIPKKIPERVATSRPKLTGHCFPSG